MRRLGPALIAAVVSLAAASLADAQSVRVRSGDHPGFSRLVLYLDSTDQARFGRVAHGYELRLPGKPDFDLSEVFVFITRDRIENLEAPGDGRLALELGCACHAVMFSIPQGLVIDVVDGAPPPDSAFEARLDGATDTPDPETATGHAGEPVLPPTLPMARSLPALPALPGLARPAELPGGAPDAGHGGDPLTAGGQSAGTEADLDALRAALLHQLGRAASQGVIELRPPEVIAGDDPVAHGPGHTIRAGDTPDHGAGDGEPHAAPATEDGTPRPPESNIRIQTVFDRDFAAAPPPALAADGATCLEPEFVDVTKWGTDPAEGADLATGGVPLVDARDRPVPGAIVARARHLVFLGFGAEAVALLDAFNLRGKNAAVIREMARIVDLDRRALSGVFAGQESCGSKVALWSILSRDGPRDGPRPDADAIVAAIAELPLHLRRHLGPEAAERFHEAGDASTAALIRNAIRRAPGDPGTATRMLEAEIALADGDHAAETELADLARGNGLRSAEALVTLIDARLKTDREVPEPLYRDAEARALEYRGTEIGRELNRVRLAALIASGRLDEALDALLSPWVRDAEIAPGARRDLMVAIVEAAARAPEIAPILPRLIGAAADPGSGDDADRARRLLAGRLLDLGLPGQAARIIERRNEVPTPEDRLILARARLMQGRGAAALMLLAGLDGDEAAALRGRAHLMAGDAAAAVEAFSDAGDEATAGTAAWIARDPARIAAHGNRLQRALGAAAATPVLAPAAPSGTGGDAMPGTLGEARALAEQSRATRDLIESLLRGEAG